jgi:hypothetical protein
MMRAISTLRAIGVPYRACAIAAAGLLLAAAPLSAAEENGCDVLLWPVTKELAAFARPDVPTIETGANGGAWVEQAFALKLKPQEDVKLPVEPSGTPISEAEKAYAGTVAFEAPAAAGVYHVTLSAPGWIEVVQNGTGLAAAAHTGAHDCPVHKSVRFEVSKAPIVLQISNAPADAIKVGIVPAVD